MTASSHRAHVLSVAFVFAVMVVTWVAEGFALSDRSLLVALFAFQNHSVGLSWVLTAWSSAIVSMSMGHAALGCLVWAVLAWVAYRMGRIKTVMLSVALAWPICHWTLSLWSQPIEVVGLSGVLFALLASVTIHAWWSPGNLAVAMSGMIYLAVRLVPDAAWYHPVATGPLWSWPVVHAVHLTGALCGAVTTLAVLLASRLRSR